MFKQPGIFCLMLFQAFILVFPNQNFSYYLKKVGMMSYVLSVSFIIPSTQLNIEQVLHKYLIALSAESVFSHNFFGLLVTKNIY